MTAPIVRMLAALIAALLAVPAAKALAAAPAHQATACVYIASGAPALNAHTGTDRGPPGATGGAAASRSPRQSFGRCCGLTEASTQPYRRGVTGVYHVEGAGNASLRIYSAGVTTSAYDGLSTALVGQTGALNSNNARATTLYQLDPAGRATAVTQANSPDSSADGTSYLLEDGQGNVGVLHTTTGANACVATYDPFGNPQLPAGNQNATCASGTQAASTANANWYRGHTRDATTGTYQLGTRTYNPQTASFTTPDYYRVSTPDRDLSTGTDPLTANTYTYVNGDPVNFYDPTGHRTEADSAAGAGHPKYTREQQKERVAIAKEAQEAAQADAADYEEAENADFDVKGVLIDVGLEVLGVTDALDCLDGSVTGCVSTILGVAFAAVWKANKIRKGVEALFDAYRKFDNAVDAARVAANAARAKAAFYADRVDDLTTQLRRARRTDLDANDLRAVKSTRRQDGPGHSCRYNSFSADTLVLMANGTKKAIGKVKVGDRVIATNPRTGARHTRRVTHLWVHRDTLVDLRIDGETLTTTEDHPFWNATDHAWQDAQHLDPGDQVLTADGELRYIQGLVSGTEHPDTAYNLTVQHTHTYHVGHHATLVHNCAADDPPPTASTPAASRTNTPEVAKGAGGLADEASALLGSADDVVVLCRQTDTAVAKAWEGHVVLDTPNWSLDLNDAFIRGAIDQGRRIYLASPTKGNLIQTSGRFAGQPTVYARELQMLRDAGYARVGDYMVPR